MRLSLENLSTVYYWLGGSSYALTIFIFVLEHLSIFAKFRRLDVYSYEKDMLAFRLLLAGSQAGPNARYPNHAARTARPSMM